MIGRVWAGLLVAHQRKEKTLAGVKGFKATFYTTGGKE